VRSDEVVDSRSIAHFAFFVLSGMVQWYTIALQGSRATAQAQKPSSKACVNLRVGALRLQERASRLFQKDREMTAQSDHTPGLFSTSWSILVIDRHIFAAMLVIVWNLT
jgi:hypothetical protein